MTSWTVATLAIAYARRGWPTFPVHAPGDSPSGCDCRRDCGKNAAKHPLTQHGVSDATTDGDQIARWWRLWPGANVAIATGARSRLVVLDVDPRSGGATALAALIARHGPLPETATVRTGGGGLHYYFAHPGGQVSNSAGKLGAGLDVRGDGGYVVAPPSMHVTGEPYVWALACNPAPLPAWLIKDAERPGVDTSSALVGVPEGERDSTLFRLACKLRGSDVPRDVAEDIVSRAGAACTPPFPQRAALHKVASAYGRYAPRLALIPEPRRRPLVNLR